MSDDSDSNSSLLDGGGAAASVEPSLRLGDIPHVAGCGISRPFATAVTGAVSGTADSVSQALVHISELGLPPDEGHNPVVQIAAGGSVIVLVLRAGSVYVASVAASASLTSPASCHWIGLADVEAPARVCLDPTGGHLLVWPVEPPLATFAAASAASAIPPAEYYAINVPSSTNSGASSDPIVSAPGPLTGCPALSTEAIVAAAFDLTSSGVTVLVATAAAIYECRVSAAAAGSPSSAAERDRKRGTVLRAVSTEPIVLLRSVAPPTATYETICSVDVLAFDDLPRRIVTIGTASRLYSAVVSDSRSFKKAFDGYNRRNPLPCLSTPLSAVYCGRRADSSKVYVPLPAYSNCTTTGGASSRGPARPPVAALQPAMWGGGDDGRGSLKADATPGATAPSCPFVWLGPHGLLHGVAVVPAADDVRGAAALQVPGLSRRCAEHCDVVLPSEALCDDVGAKGDGAGGGADGSGVGSGGDRCAAAGAVATAAGAAPASTNTTAAHERERSAIRRLNPHVCNAEAADPALYFIPFSPWPDVSELDDPEVSALLRARLALRSNDNSDGQSTRAGGSRSLPRAVYPSHTIAHSLAVFDTHIAVASPSEVRVLNRPPGFPWRSGAHSLAPSAHRRPAQLTASSVGYQWSAPWTSTVAGDGYATAKAAKQQDARQPAGEGLSSISAVDLPPGVLKRGDMVTATSFSLPLHKDEVCVGIVALGLTVGGGAIDSTLRSPALPPPVAGEQLLRWGYPHVIRAKASNVYVPYAYAFVVATTQRVVLVRGALAEVGSVAALQSDLVARIAAEAGRIPPQRVEAIQAVVSKYKFILEPPPQCYRPAMWPYFLAAASDPNSGVSPLACLQAAYCFASIDTAPEHVLMSLLGKRAHLLLRMGRPVESSILFSASSIPFTTIIDAVDRLLPSQGPVAIPAACASDSAGAFDAWTSYKALFIADVAIRRLALLRSLHSVDVGGRATLPKAKRGPAVVLALLALQRLLFAAVRASSLALVVDWNVCAARLRRFLQLHYDILPYETTVSLLRRSGLREALTEFLMLLGTWDSYISYELSMIKYHPGCEELNASSCKDQRVHEHHIDIQDSLSHFSGAPTLATQKTERSERTRSISLHAGVVVTAPANDRHQRSVARSVVPSDRLNYLRIALQEACVPKAGQPFTAHMIRAWLLSAPYLLPQFRDEFLADLTTLKGKIDPYGLLPAILSFVDSVASSDGRNSAHFETAVDAAAKFLLSHIGVAREFDRRASRSSVGASACGTALLHLYSLIGTPAAESAVLTIIMSFVDETLAKAIAVSLEPSIASAVAGDYPPFDISAAIHIIAARGDSIALVHAYGLARNYSAAVFVALRMALASHADLTADDCGSKPRSTRPVALRSISRKPKAGLALANSLDDVAAMVELGTSSDVLTPRAPSPPPRDPVEKGAASLLSSSLRRKVASPRESAVPGRRRAVADALALAVAYANYSKSLQLSDTPLLWTAILHVVAATDPEGVDVAGSWSLVENAMGTLGPAVAIQYIGPGAPIKPILPNILRLAHDMESDLASARNSIRDTWQNAREFRADPAEALGAYMNPQEPCVVCGDSAVSQPFARVANEVLFFPRCGHMEHVLCFYSKLAQPRNGAMLSSVLPAGKNVQKARKRIQDLISQRNMILSGPPDARDAQLVKNSDALRRVSPPDCLLCGVAAVSDTLFLSVTPAEQEKWAIETGSS